MNALLHPSTRLKQPTYLYHLPHPSKWPAATPTHYQTFETARLATFLLLCLSVPLLVRTDDLEKILTPHIPQHHHRSVGDSMSPLLKVNLGYSLTISRRLLTIPSPPLLPKTTTMACTLLSNLDRSPSTIEWIAEKVASDGNETHRALRG